MDKDFEALQSELARKWKEKRKEETKELQDRFYNWNNWKASVKDDKAEKAAIIEDYAHDRELVRERVERQKRLHPGKFSVRIRLQDGTVVKEVFKGTDGVEEIWTLLPEDVGEIKLKCLQTGELIESLREISFGESGLPRSISLIIQ